MSLWCCLRWDGTWWRETAFGSEPQMRAMALVLGKLYTALPVGRTTP